MGGDLSLSGAHYGQSQDSGARHPESRTPSSTGFFLCSNSAGIPYPVVSGGNTPAAFQSHRFHGVTEIRPGTYVFNDRNTVDAESASYADCAATVLTTVVSTSVPGRAIIDAGSKTLTPDHSALWRTQIFWVCSRIIQS